MITFIVKFWTRFGTLRRKFSACFQASQEGWPGVSGFMRTVNSPESDHAPLWSEW